MLSIFNKRSCLITIFGHFSKLFILIYEFYLGQIVLSSYLNERFEICFKSFFEFIPVQKTVTEVLKTWYFPYTAFRSADQWEGGAKPPWLRYCVLAQNVIDST